jgi:hypothetical protein
MGNLDSAYLICEAAMTVTLSYVSSGRIVCLQLLRIIALIFVRCFASRKRNFLSGYKV